MTRIVKAIIEMASDGGFSVFMDADDMDYLVTGTGATPEAAIRVFNAGYEDTKKYYKEEGKVFEEVKFHFVYDTLSFINYYYNSKIFTLVGLSRITGINQGQLSHYLNGFRTPSQRTVDKIQQSIKNFAHDLGQVNFT